MKTAGEVNAWGRVFMTHSCLSAQLLSSTSAGCLLVSEELRGHCGTRLTLVGGPAVGTMKPCVPGGAPWPCLQGLSIHHSQTHPVSVARPLLRWLCWGWG